MRLSTLTQRTIALTVTAILASSSAHAAPPADWKKLADRHNKCVAYVPPDWSITSTLGAAKAPGYVAGINMNSNQTKERADATWALCRPRLDVVEDKGGRRIGLMKDSGKGVSYVVQAEGSGFVCNAFVEVDQEKDVAKYGPIVKQIAQSIQPQE